MKIIIYGINFKPEIVGTGKYSGELADFLHAKGHDIRVITAPKYYPEWKVEENKYLIDKNSPYKISKCPIYVPKSPNGIKRILHLISFAITSLPVLISQLRWKPDCVIMIAPTIFCAPNIILFEFLSLRKFLTILHIQDFEIQAAFNLGLIKGKFIEKLILKIEALILNYFQLVGTISIGMREKLFKKVFDKSKIYLSPNWIDLKKIKKKEIGDKNTNKYRKKLKIPPNTIVIQFSGSMNKKQGLDFLLPIIENFKNNDKILWIFGGEGIKKKEFIYATKNIHNIKFLSLQDSKDINEWLNLGDIHIVPQKRAVENLVFPSKLLGILASGNPVISNTTSESELGKIVEQAGIRVDPEDKDGFIDGLNKLINNEKLRLSLGHRGREIAEKSFCKEKVLDEFNNLITHFLKAKVYYQ